MMYFNDLPIDIGDEGNFPSSIYERTRENPNIYITTPCCVCEDSLDEYADRFLDKLFSTLGV